MNATNTLQSIEYRDCVSPFIVFPSQTSRTDENLGRPELVASGGIANCSRGFDRMFSVLLVPSSVLPLWMGLWMPQVSICEVYCKYTDLATINPFDSGMIVQV